MHGKPLIPALFFALLLFLLVSCQQNNKDMDHANGGNDMGNDMRGDMKEMMNDENNNGINRAVAVLTPAQGNKVQGLVIFTMTDDNKVKVVADITGLTPGKHGFHVHVFGDCSATDFASAGPHFTAGDTTHGGPDANMRHTGDLGNLTAGADGTAHMEWIDNFMTLSGKNSILGRAVVVHQAEDDLKSQPAGNSGARIACGVIGIAK